MFKRNPYWGWLLISALLWGICGYYFHLRVKAMRPQSMANSVSADLKRRSNAFHEFIKESQLIKHLFADSLSENESKKLNALPFFVYGYNGDSLKFWNTNEVIGNVNDSAFAGPLIVRNEKGVFVERCIRVNQEVGNNVLVILFPVLITYTIENNYLNSHFVASDRIPARIKITASSAAAGGAYPVSMNGATPVLYLHFSQQDVPYWIPDSIFIALLLIAILSSIWWMQLIVLHSARNKSPAVGFAITLFVVLLCRSLLYIYGLPFNLDTLTFFSPGLYASSKYLSSLGDLFINLMCILWIIIFLTRHTPYKTYFSKTAKSKLRFPVAVILTMLMLSYTYLFISVIRSLVLDSSISFDVSHFYSIERYTIIGLLIIGGVTGLSYLIIFLFNVQLTVLIGNRYVKYVTVVSLGAVLITLIGLWQDQVSPQPSFDWTFYWIMLGWLLLFVVLLDIRKLTLVSDLFEPRMIFWAVFICVFSTCVLQYFNEVKERISRVAFVSKQLASNRDNFTEVSFNSLVPKIATDKQLKAFLSKPSALGRKNLDPQLERQYLGAPLNKYQATILLFNANGYQLFNKDTTDDYSSLLDEKSESDSTNSPYLFYKEDIHDRHSYLAFIPVYTDSARKAVLGYVFIDLDQKKQGEQTAVYPELLQTNTDKANLHANEYAYAIYQNDKIVAQNNDYPFPTFLKNDTLKKEQDNAFYRNHGITELYYKLSDKRVIVAVHIHSQIIELITLFSYLFVIQVILAALILLYQLYQSYFSNSPSNERLLRLTLRRRVHFSMLGVVLLSFIVIGLVTVVFFSSQYKASNSDKLQAAMQTARQTIQDNLKQQRALDAPYIFDSVSRGNGFRTFLSAIAAGRAIDINIFNRRGELLSTSEEDIYNKGLLSHMMRPDAYYQLSILGKSILVQNENVASLSYLSAYQPLRDEHGVVLGYINVPFFSSEKDLNLQISNIVVTLINLYAFIFLFSSLITVFITRWITKSFNVIIQQFGRLNLQRNERISWPYDDEIGLLVTEYNKMVNKVEENAARLAQSERESAWREMARQVAHEIKNPLTPMKLNIQFLQQAMKNNNPNIKELTDKVSHSIIEQIDNLSYIASEFSNFAKMPEARPERLELGELLDKAVELYRNDSHVAVEIEKGAQPVYVLSDRSQLLRVFTNLLENARQAIPAERKGKVHVALSSEDGEASISISDNGEGISEEAAGKLFQPYFTTKSSGTGLGLAMTKKIIEFWKGEIAFQTKVGIGTTFSIRLPLS